MTRFLNLASKALAVVGVLTLMWTAGGMQSAKADISLWVTHLACLYCQLALRRNCVAECSATADVAAYSKAR